MKFEIYESNDYTYDAFVFDDNDKIVHIHTMQTADDYNRVLSELTAGEYNSDWSDPNTCNMSEADMMECLRYDRDNETLKTTGRF